jgi:deazaflavin-dependent oxidoreductase (nitroreductase family)
MATGHEPTTASAANRGKSRVPSLTRILNPIVQRLIRLRVPLGPNALLSVRGRQTGLLRTTPVALVEVDGRRWISSTYGEVDWVRNLRATGEGIVAVGRRRETVRAVELDRGEAERFFSEILGPYLRRMPLVRWMMGSLPNARDILEDPGRAAARHPVFELHWPRGPELASASRGNK